MKVLVLEQAGQVYEEERAQPQAMVGEVVMRVQAVGLDTADVDLYQGKRPEEYCRYPVVPGHEVVGVVCDVGKDVSDIMVGQGVVVESRVFCGVCSACRSGLTNLCERGYDELGFTRTGGLAEFLSVPARLVHVLPRGVALDECVLLGSAASVLQAFQRAQPRPGANIVILGADTLSLLAVQVARLYTPAKIVVIGFSQRHLALARQFGATHAVSPGREDVSEVIKNVTAGSGADVVFEGTGDAQAVGEAIRLARPGGVVLLGGLTGSNAMLNIEADIFSLHQLALYGIAGASSGTWSYALQLYQNDLFHFSQLIEQRLPFEEYETALTTLMYKRERVLKLVLSHEE